METKPRRGTAFAEKIKATEKAKTSGRISTCTVEIVRKQLSLVSSLCDEIGKLYVKKEITRMITMLDECN